MLIFEYAPDNMPTPLALHGHGWNAVNAQNVMMHQGLLLH